DKPGRRRRLAEQPERVAKGRERLVPTRRLLGAQQVAPRSEDRLPVPRRAGRTGPELRLVGGPRGQRVAVPGLDRGVHAGGPRGRGVRSHAAADRGSQLIETGERLDLALGVEVLEAGQKAIASEDPERNERPLERAAAYQVGTAQRAPPEQRIRLHAEDVILVHNEVA